MPAPKTELESIPSRIVQHHAAVTLRLWFKMYLPTVRKALSFYGINQREDRADLSQKVFLSAYLALVRVEHFENPRAWLQECARRHASNHRHKEKRRSAHPDGDRLVNRMDPETLTSDRENLTLALAGLSEDSRALVLAIRDEGESWENVVRERGITIDKARYIYQRAVAHMAKALSDSGRRLEKIGYTRTAKAGGTSSK
jgi:DNA-directed RNA polymerase specialized sigma24 family protein